MNNRIFLARLQDRHSEDSFAAFTKLEKAIAECEKWIEEYGNRYEWEVPDWDWQDHWKFYKTTFDDGPSVSVEEIDFI